MSATPQPEVVLAHEGLGLLGSALRYDPGRGSALAFVSGGDYPRRLLALHERIITSGETHHLLQRGSWDHGLGAVLPRGFDAPFDLGGLELTLLPSGHVRGAAQLRAVLPGGETVVYAGPWRASPGATMPAGEQEPCDVLVLESTWGIPGLRLPPRREAIAQALQFVSDCLGREVDPVLLSRPLGGAMELLVALGEADIPVRVHRSVQEAARSMRRFVPEVGSPPRFEGHLVPGEVLVLPPSVKEHLALRELRRPRVAHLTGAAGRRGATILGDVGIPYADNADHLELVHYAESSSAEKVIVVGPAAEPLVESLRHRRIDAEAMPEGEQLVLFAL